MPTLILVRGVSGAGKTTFAKLISDYNISADQFFCDSDGNYNFDRTKLNYVHNCCKNLCDGLMSAGFDKIAVHNTFTTEKEMKPYFELAEKYNYDVTTIIVENRHNSDSVHNVPEAILENQKARFSIKL